MSKNILLRSQKNEIFNAILNYQYSIDEISLQEVNKSGQEEVVVRHKKSGFYFYFDLTGGYTKCSPGKYSIEETESHRSWNSMLYSFTSWLTYMRREIEQPDLWKEYFEAGRIIDTSESKEDNTRFSDNELKEIKKSIEQIKLNITQTELLDPANLKTINDKLDILIEKASYLGKADWKSIFIGTVIQTTIQLGLPPDVQKIIWDVVQNTWQHIRLLIP